MTVRRRSRIWTRQPQVGAEVDENYHDGLILCLHAPALRDISGVKNDLTYTLSVNLERVVGFGGRGVLHQNSSPTIYYANAGRLISNAKYLTISCVFQKQLSDKKFLVFAGWGAPYQALCQVNADGSILWGVYQDSGNILLKITAAGVIQTGRVHSIVASFEAGVISCFVDGVNIPLATDGWVAGSPTQIADNQTQHLNIGGYSDGDWFAGTIYHLAAWTRPGLQKQKLSENPWQIFAPRSPRRLISSGGGSSTSLTVHDAQHGHLADSLSFSLDTYLAVAESLHAHAADNVTLTTTGTANLVVQEATHTHIADGVTLTTQWLLAIAEALHSHAADNVALSLQTALLVLEALHGHSADNLTLGVTGATNLVIADATSGHAADNLAFSLNTLLAVFDAIHAHAADALTLDTSDATSLTVQDSTHGHGADSLTLSLDTWLAIVEATHGHTADSPTLSTSTALLIAEALHAHYADVVVLGFPSAPGACPTVEEIVQAVLAALNATAIPVNIKQVNSITIKGAGVTGNFWGPV